MTDHETFSLQGENQQIQNIRLRDKLDIKRRAMQGLAMAGIALAGLGVETGLKVNANGPPGKVSDYKPLVKGTPIVDDDMRVVSWNMHNETADKYKDLVELSKKYQPDAIALQEVNAKDANGLRRHFADWYINFVMASSSTRLNSGGYGNVLMTRQEPDNVQSVAMNGNTWLSKGWESLKGAVDDVSKADTSFKRTGDGTQEDRSAIAETVELQTDEGLKRVRIITTHIGGDPVKGPRIHQKQFNRLKSWTFNNEKNDEATVLCMDTNGALEDTTFDFAEKGYITPTIDETTVVTKNPNAKGQSIDQCVYKPNDILRLSKVQVLRQYATDHFAILFSRLYR